ncbi:hypothetical protein T440DRAFT_464347 [Plenodomus tracheiphilus IPT5]|uniref:PARP catalytic domain-containing protein n=1 Tax=Plenodomus tracheiphilus IPT5 TaxID=1408161 RepID=A0A6A7BJU1_9PLEO|nr:hypothetical protein T440DRAFT_464347 [Plenodomus tracheiphilus IPT5]
MDTLLLSSTVERTSDRRFRLSWTKRTIPLKRVTLFSKAKHSQEWSQNIEATAGVLHPSDPKFPHAFLQNYTDSYLQKKGKLSQADTDIRLKTLVESHGSKDIAIAAVSHTMTAKTLRSLLSAESNVAHASYWGLDTWLQCLIAANHGNAASVTDLEAHWARILLPYASHGADAAGLYLQGLCTAMRQTNVSNLDILPEFVVLLRRAFADYAAQLEGFRLRCDWNAAHTAIFWLKEMNDTSVAIRPTRKVTPERLFDHFFPAWRMWAAWEPDTNRLTRLAIVDSSWLALIGDVLSLEGPDIINGRQETLRDGLVAMYEVGKPWVQYQGLVIEVSQGKKESLRIILRRVANGVDSIQGRPAGGCGLLDLFRKLVIARPITDEGLYIFEAASGIHNTSGDDIYTSVGLLYTNQESLDGEHVASLQQVIRTLASPTATKLRGAMIHPWLIRGFEKCIKSCQAAIKAHIDDRLDWMSLALELHTFCIEVKESVHIFPLLGPDTKAQLQSWISTEHMDIIKDIFVTLQKLSTINARTVKATSAIKTPESTAQPLPRRAQKTQHPLERVIEEFYTNRCLQHGDVARETQDVIDDLLRIWKGTTGPVVDNDRRSLAILVSELAQDNSALRNECLKEIATENRLLRPPAFIQDILAIMQQYQNEPDPATVALTKLLVERQAWTRCWKNLLLIWLVRSNKSSPPWSFFGSRLLEHTLQTMRAAEWLDFMRKLEALFNGYLEPTGTYPIELQSGLLAWKSQVSKYTTTLTKLEHQLSDDGLHESVQYILFHGEEVSHDPFVSILECIDKSQGEPGECIMHLAAGKLSAKSRNEDQVKDCVLIVKGATIDEEELYAKIWSTCCGDSGIPERADSSVQTEPDQTTATLPLTRKNDLPLAVREVIVAGYLQDDTLRQTVKTAIESIAILFDLNIYKADIPAEKLNEARSFWAGIEVEIRQEAERLRGVIKQLKQVDPQGTILFLEEHGIPEQSPLDAELEQLPLNILEAIDKIGDNEVEISFPLSGLSQLQRNRMGVPKEATTVILRLSTDYTGNTPQKYSVEFRCHVSPEEKAPARKVFLWQLSRMFYLRIHKGRIPIEEIHQSVTKRIQNMGHVCVSCGRAQNASQINLIRPAPCDLTACQEAWEALPIDVRLPEIKSDPFVVDLLINAFYEAARTNKLELLPGWERLIADDAWTTTQLPALTTNIMRIANALPTLTVMGHAVRLSAILSSYDPLADRAITWSCTHFPGILATATGLCKIPNLPPGTHQFILVSSNPSQETKFAARIPKTSPQKTTVVFHGTSMDRLAAILDQGLKICSGTALQRIGAAHGKGIYLADEPSTSFSYSPAYLGWHNSGLANMRVLLGCEVAGVGMPLPSSGVHVVTDEASVMVRYVFLFPNNASVPEARHIVPAMESGIRAVKSGNV